MRTVAGLLFAAILTPLGLRLMLPFVSLPEAVEPLESLLIAWTDLLALPFVALDAGRLLEGFLPAGGRGAPGVFGTLDRNILAALIGWTIIQGAVMVVLAVFQRRSRPFE